jgi:hypothetical protein
LDPAASLPCTYRYSLFVLKKRIINNLGKKITPAFNSAGVDNGGDGGTAIPHFSMWAGLFLHLPDIDRGERVVSICPP